MNRTDSAQKLNSPLHLIKAQWPFALPALGVSLTICLKRTDLAFSGPAMQHQVLMGSILFLVLFAVFKLFALGVAHQVRRELAEYETEQIDSRRLYVFVLYKEIIKAVIGVSSLAAWGAGLLLIPDLFPLPFPAIGGLGLLISVCILALTYGFVGFVDQIRYPPQN